jgi:hypothetical protein
MRVISSKEELRVQESSVRTCNQKIAPSLRGIHMPKPYNSRIFSTKLTAKIV